LKIDDDYANAKSVSYISKENIVVGDENIEMIDTCQRRSIIADYSDSDDNTNQSTISSFVSSWLFSSTSADVNGTSFSLNLLLTFVKTGSAKRRPVFASRMFGCSKVL
jgi:lipopolysaccharide assembly outer membrane protein LptD (OstA)